MKRLVIIFSLVAICYSNTFAQEDSPTGYSSFFMLNASKYEPAILGDDMKKFHLNLVNMYAWAGNTAFTRGDLEKFVGAGMDSSSDFSIPLIFKPEVGNTLTGQDVDDFLNGLRSKNRIGFGGNVDYFNMSFRFDKEEEELFTLALTVGDRFEFNVLYPKDIFSLAWKGNKQFAGQTAEMPVSANAFWMREYALGFAMPLERFFEIPDFEFRFGSRFKYLQGLGSMYTETGDFSVFTEQDGKYLDFNYDFKFHTSGLFTALMQDEDDQDPELEEYLNNLPFGGTGAGFGADIGISAHYKERFYGNINILDIGSVTFDQHTAGFANSGSIRFEGAELDNIFSDEPELDTNMFDPIIDDIEELEGQTYKLPYPTRLRLHTSYKILAETPKGVQYHKHSFGVTYIQGLKDLGNATTRPYFAGAYVYNARSHFEVGTNIGGLGFNKLEWGLFMGVRGGPFRMGIGSGNLLSLMSKAGTGLDFNYNLTLAF